MILYVMMTPSIYERKIVGVKAMGAQLSLASPHCLACRYGLRSYGLCHGWECLVTTAERLLWHDHNTIVPPSSDCCPFMLFVLVHPLRS